MKDDIDTLLRSEKRAADAARQRQKKIGRVVALVLFCAIIGGLVIAFFIVQKDFSRQDFYKIIIWAFVIGAIAGVIEYIKIRIKGKERSLIFEAIQLLAFAISLFILSRLW
jgi:RsiW-degrading membrane proteinase PrsW (M82 family)